MSFKMGVRKQSGAVRNKVTNQMPKADTCIGQEGIGKESVAFLVNEYQLYELKNLSKIFSVMFFVLAKTNKN